MSEMATVVEEKAPKSRAASGKIINLQERIEAAAVKDADVRKRHSVDASIPAEGTQGKQADGYSTVRSGYAYDFDSTKSMASVDTIRAASVKARVADAALTGIRDRRGYRFAKRAFDITFSVAVLVLFSWLFLLIAVVIKVDDPKGPVLFKQKRVSGKGEFFMYKFRSMCVDAEKRLPELRALNEKTGPVFKIAEDPRITRVGKWLRKLSLDELPQFVNVLKGDIPLRILKTRPEFSEKSMGAFALPAKSSTNRGKAFSQVASCFASGLRTCRISEFNCNRISGMETQFFAKPVFGIPPVHTGALFQKSNSRLAEAAW
jgi:lipopolysaccharide/colanic/teichoic acid biosynthesis glycosyltransferase